MGRYLAIDFGRKRTGIAVTDPLKIIATALETVESHKAIAFLKNYLSTEPVDHFVIGMPKQLNNEDSENAKYVKQFADKLQVEFPSVPQTFVDERFTSSIALDTMIQGGMKKKDRREKGNVDKISAVLILQTFMQQQS
jgi:putative Holliday junction resolvase